VGGATTIQVQANCGGADEALSNVWSATAMAATPEFLYWVNDGLQQRPVVAVNAITGALVGPAGLIPGLAMAPAKPGDVVTIYCISLGPTNPPTPAGRAAASAAPVVAEAPIYLGAQPLSSADVLYVGASPGTAGLYQINIRVPNVAAGDLQIRMAAAPGEGYLPVAN
jgi:uncharacterized protein (TIGR03437 family)